MSTLDFVKKQQAKIKQPISTISYSDSNQREEKKPKDQTKKETIPKQNKYEDNWNEVDDQEENLGGAKIVNLQDVKKGDDTKTKVNKNVVSTGWNNGIYEDQGLAVERASIKIDGLSKPQTLPQKKTFGEKIRISKNGVQPTDIDEEEFPDLGGPVSDKPKKTKPKVEQQVQETTQRTENVGGPKKFINKNQEKKPFKPLDVLTVEQKEVEQKPVIVDNQEKKIEFDAGPKKFTTKKAVEQGKETFKPLEKVEEKVVVRQPTPEKKEKEAVHTTENGNSAKGGPMKFINNKKATEAPLVGSKNVEKSQADKLREEKEREIEEKLEEERQAKLKQKREREDNLERNPNKDGHKSLGNSNPTEERRSGGGFQNSDKKRNQPPSHNEEKHEGTTEESQENRQKPRFKNSRKEVKEETSPVTKNEKPEEKERDAEWTERTEKRHEKKPQNRERKRNNNKDGKKDSNPNQGKQATEEKPKAEVVKKETEVPKATTQQPKKIILATWD